MKEFSNKTPYLAPQLTVVEFQVERGFAESDVELRVDDVKSRIEAEQMIFGARQGNSNVYMGGQMGSYYGDAFFTGAGTGGDGGGYF